MKITKRKVQNKKLKHQKTEKFPFFEKQKKDDKERQCWFNTKKYDMQSVYITRIYLLQNDTKKHNMKNTTQKI